MEHIVKQPYAHRGLHGGGIPENSMPAFFAAICRGYGIETDVRITRDGIPVLFHDASLLRMTGVGGKIEDHSKEALSSLHLNGTKESIPTLQELLDAADGRVPLLIEIKETASKGKVVAEAVSRVLKGYQGAYAVQSFHPMYVKAYKRLCPDVPCGLLATADKSEFSPSLMGRIRYAIVKDMKLNAFVKPDFISYRLQDLPRRKVTRFHGDKLCWVVRSKEDEARAAQLGCTIIFEDYLP